MLLYNYGMIFFYINHFSLIIFYHSVWLGFELFGLVQLQVQHTLSTVHVCAQRITNVIIKTPRFYINHFSLIIFYHSVWLGFELFGLVQLQVQHTLSTVHVCAQRITNVIIKTPRFYINHFSLIIFYHSVWLGFELFSFVQLQVQHTLSTVHVCAQRITNVIIKTPDRK